MVTPLAVQRLSAREVGKVFLFHFGGRFSRCFFFFNPKIGVEMIQFDNRIFFQMGCSTTDRFFFRKIDVQIYFRDRKHDPFGTSKGSFLGFGKWTLAISGKSRWRWNYKMSLDLFVRWLFTDCTMVNPHQTTIWENSVHSIRLEGCPRPTYTRESMFGFGYLYSPRQKHKPNVRKCQVYQYTAGV